MLAHITGTTVDQVGTPPATAYAAGRWWDLRTLDPTALAACGWVAATETPRPADTAATTWDSSWTVQAGQAVQVWTERAKTAAETAAATAATNETTVTGEVSTQVDALLAAIDGLKADRTSVIATLGTAGTADTTTWRGIKATAKAVINADPSIYIKALADAGLALAVAQRSGITALTSLHRGVVRLSRLVARKLDTASTGFD